MAAAALLFFVYLGFEEVANLAEEVRHPARDLPVALFVSMAVTTALYVMVAIAVLWLASPSELAASEAPLAIAIENVWPGAGKLLSAIALFATCPCSKIYPWGNGSPLKNVADDFASAQWNIWHCRDLSARDAGRDCIEWIGRRSKRAFRPEWARCVVTMGA